MQDGHARAETAPLTLAMDAFGEPTAGLLLRGWSQASSLGVLGMHILRGPRAMLGSPAHVRQCACKTKAPPILELVSARFARVMGGLGDPRARRLPSCAMGTPGEPRAQRVMRGWKIDVFGGM